MQQDLITTAIAATDRARHKVGIQLIREIWLLLVTQIFQIGFCPIENLNQVLPLEFRVHHPNRTGALAKATLID